MTRKEILAAAEKCVCGDRDEQYGSPANSFTEIARLWSVYLDRDVSAKDVAVLMSLFKVARIKTGAQKADNWVDLAGYAACGGELDVSTVRDATEATFAEMNANEKNREILKRLFSPSAGKKGKDQPEPVTFFEKAVELRMISAEWMTFDCPGYYFDHAPNVPKCTGLHCRECWDLPWQERYTPKQEAIGAADRD